MKRFFNFLVVIYNEFFYKNLCRKFKKVAVLFSELEGGIKILEVGFGTGDGELETISLGSCKTHTLGFCNEPMYFAEIRNADGITGKLFIVKESGYFLNLFYTRRGKSGFSFYRKGVITPEGKISTAGG